MKQHLHDAVILGAGIAGGSMAHYMAAKGWDTILVDQKAFPRHKVCGEFLSPESQASLGALGLDKLVGSLQPREIGAARLIMPGASTLEIPLPGKALGVSRYSLDITLHQAVKMMGGAVHTGLTVTSVTPTDRGFRVESQHKQEREIWEARTVIGAWGRTPRAGLTASDAPAPSEGYIGIKSHFAGIKPEPVVELYFFPGGYVGVSPIDAERVNVAALVTRKAFLEAGKTLNGVLETASLCNPAFRGRMADGRPVPGSQAAVAPVLTGRSVNAWDLIPHIGDAAAVISPLCGDGMAMALRSVELCGPLADSYLRGVMGLAGWRQKYTKALRREFTGPLLWGSVLQSLLGSPAASPILLHLGRLMPGLAFRLLQATRLRTCQSIRF